MCPCSFAHAFCYNYFNDYFYMYALLNTPPAHKFGNACLPCMHVAQASAELQISVQLHDSWLPLQEGEATTGATKSTMGHGSAVPWTCVTAVTAQPEQLQTERRPDVTAVQYDHQLSTHVGTLIWLVVFLNCNGSTCLRLPVQPNSAHICGHL